MKIFYGNRREKKSLNVMVTSVSGKAVMALPLNFTATISNISEVTCTIRQINI
jgi:hypothetical protein